MHRTSISWAIIILLLAGGLGVAQRWRGGWGGGESWRPEYETCRTAREIESHSTGTPNWTNEPGFEKDAFTFVNPGSLVQLGVDRKSTRLNSSH